MIEEQYNLLFGSPVYSAILDLPDITSYVLNLKSVSKSNNMSNEGGWQSVGYNKPVDSTFNIFWDAFEEYGNRYHSQTGLKGTLKIHNLWFNVNEKGNFNWPHQHVGYAQSGTYYVKVPKNSGTLRIINPNHNVAMPTWGAGLNKNMPLEVNPNDFGIEPQEKTFLCFPSWLQHAVTPNKSDEERISIAFDYLIKLT